MLNILLIDDDSVELRLIDNMLRECYKEPYVLRYAETIEGAMSVLKTQKIDVVLLDNKLDNGVTAKDTVPMIKKLTDDVPLILISSDINFDYLKDKTILDVYDVVDKFHLRKRINSGLLSI